MKTPLGGEVQRRNDMEIQVPDAGAGYETCRHRRTNPEALRCNLYVNARLLF